MARVPLSEVDDILAAYNISRSGEDIRRALFLAGYVIVSVNDVPKWRGYSNFDHGNEALPD